MSDLDPRVRELVHEALPCSCPDALWHEQFPCYREPTSPCPASRRDAVCAALAASPDPVVVLTWEVLVKIGAAAVEAASGWSTTEVVEAMRRAIQDDDGN